MAPATLAHNHNLHPHHHHHHQQPPPQPLTDTNTDIDDVLKNTAISMVEFLHSSTPTAPVPPDDPSPLPPPLPEQATLSNFFQYPSTGSLAAKSQHPCFVQNTPPSLLADHGAAMASSQLNANAPVYESPFLPPQAQAPSPPTNAALKSETACTPNVSAHSHRSALCAVPTTENASPLLYARYYENSAEFEAGGEHALKPLDGEDLIEEQKELEMAREMELVLDMMKHCTSSPSSSPVPAINRNMRMNMPDDRNDRNDRPAQRMEGEDAEKPIHRMHTLQPRPSTAVTASATPTTAVRPVPSKLTVATTNTLSSSKARRSRKRNRAHGDKKSNPQSRSQSQSQSNPVAGTTAAAAAAAPASQTASSSSSSSSSAAFSSAASKQSVSWCAIAKTAKTAVHPKKLATDDEKSPEVAWGIISTSSHNSSTTSSSSQKVNPFTPSPTPPNNHASKDITAPPPPHHHHHNHHHLQPLPDEDTVRRRNGGPTSRFQMRTTTTTTPAAAVSPSAHKTNHQHHGGGGVGSGGDGQEKCRIFVSNLPSDATDEQIRHAFAHCGDIKNTVWFPSKTDGKFYGRGLITFADASSSERALEMNRGVVLGRAIKVEYSSCDDPVKIKPPGCRTVYLNNVPPDAQESRIREVFRHCGKIKRVRFHERDTKRTGGAFVEFEHSSACDKALALHGKIVDNFPLYVDYQRY